MKNKFILYWILIMLPLLFTTCKKEESNNTSGVVGFEGTYQVRENCLINGYSAYTIQIKSSGINNQVNIYNFFNVGSSKYIFGEVDGLTINIPPQTYTNYTILGSGNIKGSNLIIDYKIDDGVMQDSCSANCVKQQ